jgi:uncharacterized membrane protein
MNYVFVFAFGIGVVAGLRSLLAPAIVAWAAHFDLLNLNGSPLAFMGSRTALVIFTVFAIVELIGDKLPKTPKRTAVAPLVARILLGGLSGACLFVAAGKSLLAGTLLGGIGGVIGAFVGYEIRRRIVNNLHVKDLFVAICEDVVAIALACFFVSH